MRVIIEHNIPNIRKAIKGLGSNQPKIDQVLSKGSAWIARDAKELAPKNQSTLAQSIKGHKVKSLFHEVVAGTNYARAVEEGTEPGGFPPEQAILDWIKTARIEPDDPFMEQEDLAFVIARSIHQRGTAAQPYMQPAVEKNATRIDVALRHAIAHSWRN